MSIKITKRFQPVTIIIEQDNKVVKIIEDELCLNPDEPKARITVLEKKIK